MSVLPRVSEAAFQRQVLELARIRGWLAYHTFNSRRSAAGFPDLVLARRGRVIFAELKTDRGMLRPAQEAWLAALKPLSPHSEHAVFVWRPRDWQRIEEALE